MLRAPTSIRNPALREGVYFGVILGIILIILNLITNFVPVVGYIATLLLLVLALGAFGFAGLRASQQTGRVGTGALAGLWTGLISYLISFIVSLIVTFATIDAVRQSTQQLYDKAAGPHIQVTNQLVIQNTVLAGIIFLVVAGLIGLAVGAIGGVLGKGRARIPMQEYQESYYQPHEPGEQ